MSFILALLLAIQAIQPFTVENVRCGGEAEACVDHCNDSEDGLPFQLTAEEGHSEDHDCCPPGCSCLCCSLVVAHTWDLPVTFGKRPAHYQNDLTPQAHPQDFGRMIWHPPRLS